MEAALNCRRENLSHQPSTKHAVQATQTGLAAVSDSRSLELNLATQEGDKVTLSMDAKASAIYACHGAVGMDGQQLNAQWGEFGSGQFEREVILTVEGDLNQQERREIRKVIGTINRMIHGFVQANLSSMMDNTYKLQYLETIDSLEVTMSCQRRVLVARQNQAAVLYDRTGEVTSPRAVTGDPVAQTPVTVQARTVAGDMAEAVRKSKAPRDAIQATADRLLQAYRDWTSQWNPLGGHILDHIRDIFDSAMETVRQGEDDVGDRFRPVADWH
jgi:hypothetical protein